MKTSTFGFIRFRHHALGESRARGRARRRRRLSAPAPQQQPKPEPDEESRAGVAQEIEGERRRAHERSDAGGEQRQLDEPGRDGAERGSTATTRPWPTPRLTTSIVSGPGTACMASTAARNAMKVAASGIYGLHPANAAPDGKVRLLGRLHQLRHCSAAAASVSKACSPAVFPRR
jgi:hypothetical protein